MVTNTGWYGQVGVFLEAFSKWAFGFTYVLVCKVQVACYIVYDPTLLVFRVYEDGTQLQRKKTSRDQGF